MSRARCGTMRYGDKMILKKITTVSPVENGEKAFFDGGVLTPDGITVKAGEKVSFATFFNAIDAEFLKENTLVNEVRFVMEFSGRAETAVYRCVGTGKIKKGETSYRTERVAASVGINSCSVPAGTARGGILLAVVKAETDVVIRSARWECDDSCAINPVKPGFVICTYKRENDALRNAETICSALEGTDFDVFVVDNGNTLNKDALPEKATLISSKNLGGSGGFSRGMLSCLSSGDTHVFLADDDAVLCGETARYAVNLLTLLKKEKTNISLGGAMFSLSDPTVVYEQGAYFGKLRLRLPKHNIQTTRTGGLTACMAKANVNYCGWWFCAYPTKTLRKNGLSLPLFIKYDDAEFGLRNELASPTVFPLGIGVWHKDFETKLTPETYYYLRRNSLIALACNSKGSAFAAECRLWGSFVKFIGKGKRELAFVIDGIRDYLCGPSFIDKVDQTKLNAGLKTRHNGRISGLGLFFRTFALGVKIVFLSHKVNAEFFEERDALCSVRAWEERFGLSENEE